MSAKVICFVSSKGGSGKTIIAANIASFLGDIGKRCLVIDCDAATHGMTLLYLVEVSKNAGNDKYGLFDLGVNLNSEEVVKNGFVKVDNDVDLLPATYNFKLGFDPEENFTENVLKEVVALSRDSYDFILLDAQAGSDKYSRLVMDKNISDEVVIVSEYDPLSAAGIERLKQVVGKDLGYTRTWILLNKMLPEFVEKFSEFLSIAQYLPPIPWNAEVVRAYARRKLALDVEKGNVFTLAIMRTVSALLGESIESEIKAWSEKRSYALKEPLVKQYANAEDELKFLLKAKKELEFKKRRRKIFVVYTALAPVVLMPFIFFKLSESSMLLSKLLGVFDKVDTSTVTVTVLMAVGIALPALLVLSSRLFDVEESTESARFQRQIELLEEKLKQLEALKSADLETIIKSNHG